MGIKVNDMLEDIKHIMKNAVLIAPRIFELQAPIDSIEKDIDIFHLQNVDDIDYIIDKMEYLCAKYRNVYIVAETTALASLMCGFLSQDSYLEDTNFECNVFYLHFDKKISEYLPYRINE